MSDINDAILREIETRAVDYARGAGKILAENFGKPVDFEFKDEAQSDPVSVVDKATQEYIYSRITKDFPGHGLVGEEDEPAASDSAPNSRDPAPNTAAPDFVWCIDPLDGTKNYLSGLPLHSSSIGVLYKGRSVAGAIYTPWPGKPDGVVFHARKGGGAFVDDEPIHVYSEPKPDNSRIVVMPTWFPRRYEMPELTGEHRNLGSTAFDLAATAKGVLQYAVMGRPYIWDMAAGLVIVEESGGVAMVPGPPDHRNARSPEETTWIPFESFFTARGGGTTENLRAWRSTVILGNPSIVRYITRNLRRRRVPWRERLSYTARWIMRG
jgi:myo-inositol-1(or 4)-monophosphatase